MSNAVIKKDSLNNIVLTLRERSQLSNPYYLFVFTNKFSTKPVIAKCVVQTSFSNSRYDLVQIEDKSSPDPLAGEVFLIAGEWSYEVYESIEPTLVVAETTERLIQRGFIVVKK